MKRIWMKILLAGLLGIAIVSCAAAAGETNGDTAGETGKGIRIIATSDLHGKMVPWDYALDAESLSGSMTQLAAAIKEYRTDSTLLVDAGDAIQDNSAEIFNGRDDIHPMIQALNALDYDVFVTGNHEFNFGMDVTKKAIADLNAKVLVGNVYDKEKKPLADGYDILEINGVQVAVIGMVTPLIKRWDVTNLEGCDVTDPLVETRKIIEKISGSYDVLVGVFHMSVDNEYDMKNSGVRDILESCPEFDVMVSSHQHIKIEGEEINGALTVQNMSQARTMSVIDLTLVPEGKGWKVAEKTSESIEIAGYKPDPDMTSLLEKYDREARENAQVVIGKLEGGPLAPENEMDGVPTALIRDTAMMDLVNEVQLHYTGADVSVASMFSVNQNMQPGNIRRCDVSLIYKYPNTLYKLHMTGAQLRKYMEWSARYYNTWHPGDKAISFNPDIEMFNYDIFAGVKYEINISRDPGSRIENLTWQDGKPVQDTDEFDIAVNNYRANTQLLTPGVLFEKDDMPKLLEMDVHGEIGGVREMILDYIMNVKKGVITPVTNNSWKTTGWGR